MKNLINYEEFVNENVIGTFKYKVVLFNGQEQIFDRNDFISVIKYLYDNREQCEWVVPPVWPYQKEPNVDYYNQIYKELGIENEHPYISSQGGFYIGLQEDMYNSEPSKKLYIGSIYQYRPWKKFKYDKLNQQQLKQREFGYDRFIP